MPRIPDAVARALWEAARLPVVVSSRRGVVFANKGFTDLTGIAEDDILGQPLTALTRPYAGGGNGTSPAAMNGHAEMRWLITGEGSAIETEQTVYTIDVGGERYAVSAFQPVTAHGGANGPVPGGERRASGGLADDGVSGRFVAASDGRLIDCNETFARIVGVSRTDLIRRTIRDFTADEPMLRKLFATARVEHRAGPVEISLDRPDGDTAVALCWVVAYDDGAEEVSLSGQLIDVTEMWLQAMRLRGAERMEAIGRLAGGLAHDFNNLLMVVGGNADRLIEALPDRSPLHPMATAIRDATGRATSLTRQLLAYGRRQVFSIQPVALPDLVSGARAQLAEVLGDRITLDVDVDSSVPPINADRRQLESVLSNLAANAREAMPSGGALRIVVDAVSVDDEVRRDRQWLRPGRYARLVVSDSGRGMDAATRARAFQPFFTTRPIGDGRGLGLATVYGIVKQSGGFIWVDSEPGQGARFTLLFPEVLPVHHGREGRGAAETILIVDDDTTARTLAAEALGRRGYDIIQAPGPDDAVALAAAHPGRVHLLVADADAVTSDGALLSARLRALEPMLQSLAVLPARAEPVGSVARHWEPALQKPYTLRALAAKVRAVLDSGEGR